MRYADLNRLQCKSHLAILQSVKIVELLSDAVGRRNLVF